MGKQQAETLKPAMVDEALRRQVAQWVREALGELVEDDEVERDQAVAASLALRYSKVTGAGRASRRDRTLGRAMRKKGE